MSHTNAPYLTTAIDYYNSTAKYKLPQDFVPQGVYMSCHLFTLDNECFLDVNKHDISILDDQEYIDQLTTFMLLSSVALGEY